MSGAWGVERARCQAALAVLASLCRARPPPVGLDVQTCRSFELQTPERRPSAADAGNAKAEAPPFLDHHPNCPPPPSVPNPLAPGAPSPLVPWPVARRAGGAAPRGPGRRGPPPRARVTPRGPRGKLGPGDAAPLGASVSLRSLRAPWGRSARGGVCAGSRPRTSRLRTNSAPREVAVPGPACRSVRPSVCSRGERGPSPRGLPGRNLGLRPARGLCAPASRRRAAPRASAGGRGGRCRSVLPRRL